MLNPDRDIALFFKLLFHTFAIWNGQASVDDSGEHRRTHAAKPPLLVTPHFGSHRHTVGGGCFGPDLLKDCALFSDAKAVAARSQYPQRIC